MTDLFSVFAVSKAEKDSHVSLNKFFIVEGLSAWSIILDRGRILDAVIRFDKFNLNFGF